MAAGDASSVALPDRRSDVPRSPPGERARAPPISACLYSGEVADLPFTFTSAAIASQLARVVDRDGKIPRAFADLGAVADRDVVLLRADGDIRASQLRAVGARVTQSADDGHELRPACADVVIRCWGEAGAVAVPVPASLVAAERLLRPGGRLLIVADYGRDDVARLRPEGETPEIYRALRARDAAFSGLGFKLHVIHGWWTFDSLDEAADFLAKAFGERGAQVAGGMRRPRLSHKVVVYHRGPAPAVGRRERDPGTVATVAVPIASTAARGQSVRR